MSIEELIEYCQDLVGSRNMIVGGVLLILSGIEFTPIKINPLTYIKKLLTKLLNSFGDLINHNVINKIDKMDTEMTSLKDELNKLYSKIECVESKDDERDAINTRNRILLFGDDLMHGILHSEDSYEQALSDIQKYNDYCSSHPDFKNHITTHHAKLIEDRYVAHLENNDCLQ